MFAVQLNGQWMAWVGALAKPLHGRSAWRLADVIMGILLAHGRRTVSSWWRAAGVGEKFRGRPPIYGENRLSLAKRAGQTRGWQTVEVATTARQVVTETVKTFLATWHPAGGVVRVVIIKEDEPRNRRGPQKERVNARSAAALYRKSSLHRVR